MLQRAHRPLEFVGIDELERRAHVMVDGAARPGSVLVLSHWPGSPTEEDLRADLSTEIAFRYLRHRPRTRARLVTCDHLDEDGLASLAVITHPEEALRNEALLVGLARAGDFGVVENDASAKLAFLLHSFFDPERSPYAAGFEGRKGSPNPWTAHCYQRALGELFSLIADLDEHRDLYEKEWISYTSSQDAITSGRATLEEDPALGLCIVRLDPYDAMPSELRSRKGTELPLHPYAIHSSTAMARIVIAVGERFLFYDRYETWVRYVSRQHIRRVDMAPLAATLSSLEGGATTWHADPPGSIEPVLAPRDRASTLSEEAVLDALRHHLENAPIAWDPFS